MKNRDILLDENELGKILNGKRATLLDVGEFGFYLDVDGLGEVYVSCASYYDSIYMEFWLTPRAPDAGDSVA